MWVSFLSCELLKGTYAHLTFTPRTGRHLAYRPDHNVYLTVYTNGDTSGTLYIGKTGVMEAYSAGTCGPGNTAQCFTSLAGVSYPKNS